MATTTSSIPEPQHFRNAVRINASLTAKVEARVLQALARNAPRWVTSDQLTLLGFVAQLATGVLYAITPFYPSALLWIALAQSLNWLGDSLDGTLARVRNCQRPRYGFYVDHIVDIFGSTALCLGLACSGLLHLWVAAALLTAFLLLAAESYLATYTLGRFQLSQGLFGPTEIRILLTLGSIAAWRNPWGSVLGHRFLLFDLSGAIAVIVMLAMVAITAARHTAELYRQEPLP